MDTQRAHQILIAITMHDAAIDQQNNHFAVKGSGRGDSIQKYNTVNESDIILPATYEQVSHWPSWSVIYVFFTRTGNRCF